MQTKVLIGPLSIGQLGFLFAWLVFDFKHQTVRIYNRL